MVCSSLALRNAPDSRLVWRPEVIHSALVRAETNIDYWMLPFVRPLLVATLPEVLRCTQAVTHGAVSCRTGSFALAAATRR